MDRLAKQGLIDPKQLSQCKNAGKGGDPTALAEYLATCTNGTSAALECYLLGKGGPGGGGPAAPMTWTDGTSEQNQKFQEHALPPATQLSSARLIGVSRAAPQINGQEVVSGHGALDNAVGNGGSAQTQVILPEHRQAVQNFFKREP